MARISYVELGGKMNRPHVFLTILFFLNTTFAAAYCPDYPGVEQDFLQSELVFVGKVFSEEKVNETKDGFFDGINYKIEVSEVLHGKPAKVVTVFSENSSGRFPMVIGESYLIFTSITLDTFARVPVYTISSCGNSGEISKKKDALLQVRELSALSRDQHTR